MINSSKAFRMIADEQLNRQDTNDVINAFIDIRRFFKTTRTKLLELEDLSSEKFKLKAYLKEKVRFLSQEIENSFQEIELFLTKYDSQQIQNKTLWESHEKAQKLLKKIEMDKNKDIEKFCINCHRWFKDSENFNWSCKRHASEWNGDNYWCCGSNKKESKGCLISVHMSEESELQAQVAPILGCLTCGKTDHKFTECIKDPNCINRFEDSRAEIERVLKVRKRGKEKSRKPYRPLVEGKKSQGFKTERIL